MQSIWSGSAILVGRASVAAQHNDHTVKTAENKRKLLALVLLIEFGPMVCLLVNISLLVFISAQWPRLSDEHGSGQTCFACLFLGIGRAEFS